MKILVADNDVLVEILDQLHAANHEDFDRTMVFLRLRYSRIWLPRIVMNEFGISSRRRRHLRKLIQSYPFFLEECPVPVSWHERVLLISGEEGIDEGEADGITQAKKAEMLPRYPQEFVFFSHDKKAFKRAEKSGVATLNFKDFRAEVREAGIVI